MKPHVLILTLVFMLSGLMVQAQSGIPDKALQQIETRENKAITVMWSSPVPKVFENCITPFCKFSGQEDNFKEVTLFIWGPAIEVLKDNQDLQDNLVNLMSKGVDVKACESACEKHNIAQDMAQLGVKLCTIEEKMKEDVKDGVTQLINL